MKRIFLIISVTIFLFSCNSGNNKNINGTAEISKPEEKQLNISILLDLSDRINPKINPQTEINDIENIKTVTELFKSNMEKLGAYRAKGRIRLIFSPTPTSPDINSVVDKLNIDCSKLDNKGRKEVFDSITELYNQKMKEIYQKTISTSNWEGSDIWRFFKDDVKDYCVDEDTLYRNILVILTDGYLYHKQSAFNINNRYTYLLGNRNLKEYRKQNWEQLIKQNDFGIITNRNDLNNLEVLVLEINAENENYKIDEDILCFLWKKWFKEMGVKHYEVYRSDLPANTKKRIFDFFK